MAARHAGLNPTRRNVGSPPLIHRASHDRVEEVPRHLLEPRGIDLIHRSTAGGDRQRALLRQPGSPAARQPGSDELAHLSVAPSTASGPPLRQAADRSRRPVLQFHHQSSARRYPEGVEQEPHLGSRVAGHRPSAYSVDNGDRRTDAASSSTWSRHRYGASGGKWRRPTPPRNRFSLCSCQTNGVPVPDLGTFSRSDSFANLHCIDAGGAPHSLPTPAAVRASTRIGIPSPVRSPGPARIRRADAVFSSVSWALGVAYRLLATTNWPHGSNPPTLGLAARLGSPTISRAARTAHVLAHGAPSNDCMESHYG